MDLGTSVGRISDLICTLSVCSPYTDIQHTADIENIRNVNLSLNNDKIRVLDDLLTSLLDLPDEYKLTKGMNIAKGNYLYYQLDVLDLIIARSSNSLELLATKPHEYIECMKLIKFRFELEDEVYKIKLNDILEILRSFDLFTTKGRITVSSCSIISSDITFDHIESILYVPSGKSCNLESEISLVQSGMGLLYFMNRGYTISELIKIKFPN